MNSSVDCSRITRLFQCEQKSIPGLNVLFLILFFAFTTFGFTQILAEDYYVTSGGATSSSEISRELSPSLTDKAYSTDSSYILKLSFGKLIPQQFSLPPPDNYTGSDSFSEHSREGLNSDDPLLPLLP